MNGHQSNHSNVYLGGLASGWSQSQVNQYMIIKSLSQQPIPFLLHTLSVDHTRCVKHNHSPLLSLLWTYILMLVLVYWTTVSPCSSNIRIHWHFVTKIKFRKTFIFCLEIFNFWICKRFRTLRLFNKNINNTDKQF